MSFNLPYQSLTRIPVSPAPKATPALFNGIIDQIEANQQQEHSRLQYIETYFQNLASTGSAELAALGKISGGTF